MNWLAEYGFETADSSAALGEPATLTVIKRSLDSRERSYEILPVEPAPAGEEQRDAILRAMAGRFPDADWKTYNPETRIASFVGDYLYIVIYEEHEVETERAPTERPTLFAV